MGKGADTNNILDKDIPVIVTNRGGDLTCHTLEKSGRAGLTRSKSAHWKKFMDINFL